MQCGGCFKDHKFIVKFRKIMLKYVFYLQRNMHSLSLSLGCLLCIHLQCLNRSGVSFLNDKGTIISEPLIFTDSTLQIRPTKRRRFYFAMSALTLESRVVACK